MKYYLLSDNISLVSTTEYIDDALELSYDEYIKYRTNIEQIPYYWNGTQWLTRPTWEHDTPIEIDETQVAIFTLPEDYTDLRIDNHPTSKNIWTPPGHGTYTVRVEPFPYMPLDIQINVAVNLNKEKERKETKLEADCHNYIIKHYPDTRQHTFKAYYIRLVEELNFNSANYTSDQIDSMTNAKGKLLAVFDWINSILQFYYDKLNEINGAGDLTTLESITWDFSQFDATDPGVTIEEIRSALAETGIV